MAEENVPYATPLISKYPWLVKVESDMNTVFVVTFVERMISRTPTIFNTVLTDRAVINVDPAGVPVLDVTQI